jgi:hypothetical protein
MNFKTFYSLSVITDGNNFNNFFKKHTWALSLQQKVSFYAKWFH